MELLVMLAAWVGTLAVMAFLVMDIRAQKQLMGCCRCQHLGYVYFFCVLRILAVPG